MKIFYIILIVLLTHHSKGQLLSCYVCEGDDCNNISTMREETCGLPETTTIPPTTAPESTTATMETTTQREVETTGSGENSTRHLQSTTESGETNKPEGTTNESVTITEPAKTTMKSENSTLSTTVNAETTTMESEPTSKSGETVTTTSQLETTDMKPKITKAPTASETRTTGNEGEITTNIFKTTDAETTAVAEVKTTAEPITNKNSSEIAILDSEVTTVANIVDLNLTTTYTPLTATAASSLETDLTNTIAPKNITSASGSEVTPLEKEATSTTTQNSGEKALQTSWPSAGIINSYHRIGRSVIYSQNLTYTCYSAEFKDNNEIKLKKGCVAIPTMKSACQVVAEVVGDRIVENSCKVCTKDLCNASTAIRLSIFTIFVVIFTKFLT